LTPGREPHYDSGFPGGALYSVRRERLVLTLPPDSSFARLTRLAALHFLRQHGVAVHEAQRDARRVESSARAALRTAGKGQGRHMVALTCTSDARTLEIVLSRSRGGSRRLLHLEHDGGSP
jgi:hypothetical protein